MEFNIQRLFSENHLRAYFTMWGDWADWILTKEFLTIADTKVDMKDAPLVGKLGSTERSKSLKD